ncbi:outer membrane protein transport protein [Chitinibacter sp. SCUT-21]|uniref:OmpP1/FadL family transporter n=1 Tax=Chitinibacter sp. SCUT-21 TaxID=2970891 RepID=UPI0035A6CA69
MMKKPYLIAALCTLSLTQAQAAGLYLYEIGSEDLGLASAGAAARAMDSSTIFSNPAGLTRIDGDRVDTGLQLLFGNTSYHITDGVASGDDPGNVLQPFPGGSLFYSHSVNERLKIGLGFWGNFGLALHYGDWAGSALVKDATQLALTIQPTIAYRLNDQWSIGGGIGINYGYFALNRSTARGEALENDHDWEPNLRVGLLFEPNTATRFGLNYASQAKYDFQINPNVTFQLPATGQIHNISIPLETQVNAPQQLMLSAYHQVAPEWAIMGNVGWQDWSAFNHNQSAIYGEVIASKPLYQDTLHLAVGAQYQANSQWRYNFGMAYDSSMYKDQSQGVLTTPSGETWRFGTGLTYQLDQVSTLGFAAEYARVQSNKAPNHLFGGEFDTGHLYFLSSQYSRKF